jgi:hypothetical protein
LRTREFQADRVHQIRPRHELWQQSLLGRDLERADQRVQDAGCDRYARRERSRSQPALRAPGKHSQHSNFGEQVEATSIHAVGYPCRRTRDIARKGSVRMRPFKPTSSADSGEVVDQPRLCDLLHPVPTLLMTDPLQRSAKSRMAERTEGLALAASLFSRRGPIRARSLRPVGRKCIDCNGALAMRGRPIELPGRHEAGQQLVPGRPIGNARFVPEPPGTQPAGSPYFCMTPARAPNPRSSSYHTSVRLADRRHVRRR